MLSGNWKEDWGAYLGLLACLGGVLLIIMIAFGVPENSPWLLIPGMLVIPGFLLLLVGCIGLPIYQVLRPLTRVFERLVVVPSESTLLTVVDVFWAFLNKILSRLLLIAAVFVVAYLLRNENVYFVIPLSISLFVIYRFPPSIETLYIMKKTGEPKQYNSNFRSLLKVSKDKDSGEYRVGQSIAVKSYSKPFLRRYWIEFSSKQNPDDYEVFIHSKTKRDYNDHYLMFV